MKRRQVTESAHPVMGLGLGSGVGVPGVNVLGFGPGLVVPGVETVGVEPGEGLGDRPGKSFVSDEVPPL